MLNFENKLFNKSIKENILFIIFYTFLIMLIFIKILLIKKNQY